jgi:hypothetical protein
VPAPRRSEVVPRDADSNTNSDAIDQPFFKSRA